MFNLFSRRKLRRRSVLGASWSIEALEPRALPAAMALLSGSVDGNASYYWSAPGGPTYSRSDPLTETDAIWDYDRYYVASPERPTLSVPVVYITSNIGGGAAPHHSLPTHEWNTSFRIDQYAGVDSEAHRVSASSRVATSSPLLYQIQASEPFETWGTPVGLNFDMDAILGASQYLPSGGVATGLSLDYVVSYHIYRQITVDGISVTVDLAKDRFEGSATVLTNGGTFDRFQRTLELEAQVGDYMELIVDLDGIMTEGTKAISSDIAAFVGFDWGLEATAAPPVTLGVSAQHNELSNPTPTGRGLARAIQISSDKFGPYLPGVELQNKFTVTVSGDGAAVVDEVSWSVGGEQGFATRVSGTDNWQFTMDMGEISAGEHDLIVLARDSSGAVLQEHHSKVVHRSALNFELKVDPGSTDEFINVEEARFFQGVAASLQFEGTIEGLAKFYSSQSKVFIGNTPVPVTFVNTANGAPAKFTFTHNVGTLTPGPLGTIGVDVEFGGGKRSMTDFGDSKEPLRPVAKPTWLATASVTYNPTSGEYEFHNYRPSLFNYEATIAKTGQKWLDSKLKKLETYARLEAVLNIDAPLQVAQSPTYDASQLVIRAKVLGEPVTDKTYSSSTLEFGGSLNAETLELTTFGIKLKNPVPIANQTFLDKQFSVNLVDKIAPGLPEWLVSARFDLGIKLFSSLTVDAGIELTKVGSTVQYVSSGTYLKLAANPTANLTAGLTAKVGGGWLADFSGSIGGQATIDLSTAATFSGAVGSVPKVQTVSVSAKFTFAYQIKIQGTLAKTVQFVNYDSAAPENGGPDDDVFGPYELLSYSSKPTKPGKGRNAIGGRES